MPPTNIFKKTCIGWGEITNRVTWKSRNQDPFFSRIFSPKSTQKPEIKINDEIMSIRSSVFSPFDISTPQGFNAYQSLDQSSQRNIIIDPKGRFFCHSPMSASRFVVTPIAREIFEPIEPQVEIVRGKMLKKQGKLNTSFQECFLTENEARKNGPVKEEPMEGQRENIFSDYFSKKVGARRKSESFRVFGGFCKKEKTLVFAAFSFPLLLQEQKKKKQEKEMKIWIHPQKNRISVLSGISTKFGLNEVFTPGHMQKALRRSTMATLNSENNRRNTFFMKILNEGVKKAEKPVVSRNRQVSISRKDKIIIKENVGFSSIPECVRIRASSIKSNLSSLKKKEQGDSSGANKSGKMAKLKKMMTMKRFLEPENNNSKPFFTMSKTETTRPLGTTSIAGRLPLEMHEDFIFTGDYISPLVTEDALSIVDTKTGKKNKAFGTMHLRRDTDPVIHQNGTALERKKSKIKKTKSISKEKPLFEYFAESWSQKKGSKDLKGSFASMVEQGRPKKMNQIDKKAMVLSVYTHQPFKKGLKSSLLTRLGSSTTNNRSNRHRSLKKGASKENFNFQLKKVVKT